MLWKCLQCVKCTKMGIGMNGKYAENVRNAKDLKVN